MPRGVLGLVSRPRWAVLPASALAALCVAAATPTTASALETGVVVGNAPEIEVPYVRALRARSVRVEVPIGESAAALEATFSTYAAAGVRPLLLAGFPHRTPTAEEAANLASWAAAYGRGGTYWRSHPGEATSALTHIEFGNEASYPSQYPELASDPDWATTSAFRGYARSYALAFRTAAIAVRGTGRPVGLLAVGDVPGRWSTWMDGLFGAVPGLASDVAGWTAHPYGPRWRSSLDFVVSETRRHGAPASIPIYVTEVGVANDGGRCLDQNFGWSRCASSSRAGADLSRQVTGMRRRYRSRLAGVWLFHAHDLARPGRTSSSVSYFGVLRADGRSKGRYTAAARRVLALR